MSERRPADFGESATLEVRAYREGKLVERAFCETEQEAADVVAAWEELEAVECVVDDLSAETEDVGSRELERDAGDDYPSVPDAGGAPGW